MTVSRKTKKKLEDWANYLFILVPLALIVVLMIVPFARTIYYSFTKFNGFHTPTFVGFKNYLFLGENTHFLNAIKNNFLISLATPLWAGIPLFIAVILFQNLGSLLKTARMTLMLPFAISMSISAGPYLSKSLCCRRCMKNRMGGRIWTGGSPRWIWRRSSIRRIRDRPRRILLLRQILKERFELRSLFSLL